MNTTAHVVINLSLLGPKTKWQHPWVIVTGALLPDALMIVFYLIQKLIFRSPEEAIWNDLYFRQHWQAVFDVFNSIPIIGLLWLIAWRKKWPWLQLLCASLAMHVALDFPFHREDAHHHFWPLSDYQFISPVSYWDPAYYGTYFMAFEIILTALLSIYCFRRVSSKLLRIGIVLMNIAVLGMIGFWMLYFGGQ